MNNLERFQHGRLIEERSPNISISQVNILLKAAYLFHNANAKSPIQLKDFRIPD